MWKYIILYMNMKKYNILHTHMKKTWKWVNFKQWKETHSANEFWTDWPLNKLALPCSPDVSVWEVLPQDLPWQREMTSKQKLGVVGQMVTWQSLKCMKPTRRWGKLGQDWAMLPPPRCCCCSFAKCCLSLWDPMHPLPPTRLPCFTNSWSLLKFISIKSVMLSNHLIFCCPHLLLPSIFPSIRVFSNELTLCIRWPKVSELQLKHQSFRCLFRVDFLWNWLVWGPCTSKGISSLL